MPLMTSRWGKISAGGGRYSARETIGRVAAGAVAKKFSSYFQELRFPVVNSPKYAQKLQLVAPLR
ncbi:chorismate synthase, putative [Actinidia rufa]|uniref:chorismate synthase n=1 Tax=Actinidia rufa TaxID=165716 RepID=A0A7J0G4X8_9ERIC|nr:chorismate synthase, putative [Actinidia rufa]